MRLWFTITACMLTGCEGEFGADFIWGTATSGFQVDMGCPTLPDDQCVDSNSDWYQFVTTEENIDDSSLFISGDPVSMGPGMWETFEEDVARMESDGLGGYRMGIEWSRIFPDGAAEAATTVEELAEYANASAVARYREMFAALNEAEIHPLVTLNHYTLPLWVHDGNSCQEDPLTCEASGWVNGERIIRLIALYAEYCGVAFGDQIDDWMTLNEPFATMLSGYLLPGESRSAPPGVFNDTEAGIAVMIHQLEGHAAMYDAVHAGDTVDADGDGAAATVGIVLNMVAITPKNPDNEDDVLGAEHVDYLYHGLYLNALTSGDWDDDLDGVPDRVREDLANRLDVIGINYYNQLTVMGLPIALIENLPISDFYPEFSWDPYTEGLAEVIERAGEYNLPMVITENGTPSVEDAPEILDGHLTSLRGAIEGGADVRGYYYWSFIDNYEWNHGMGMQFGLYELDTETKERTARPVLERYREIIRRGKL